MIPTILIDDELSSLNSLKNKLISHFPELDIKAACNTAGEGLMMIEKIKPSLVFLDIEMPIMNGFLLLQNLTYTNFELIFVTAYDHYAIKAIKYSALDYLVKPVVIDELASAVNKAIARQSNSPNQRLELLLENTSVNKTKFGKIAIPSIDGLAFIEIRNIRYLEASGNYTRVFTADTKQFLSSRYLKEYEEILPPETFIRIHNSHIINKAYITRYIRRESGGSVVLEGNITLDISKRRKADFLKALDIG